MQIIPLMMWLIILCLIQFVKMCIEIKREIEMYARRIEMRARREMTHQRRIDQLGYHNENQE